jgi:hypothetical protein
LDAKWAPEPIWTLWRWEKSLPYSEADLSSLVVKPIA